MKVGIYLGGLHNPEYKRNPDNKCNPKIDDKRNPCQTQRFIAFLGTNFIKLAFLSKSTLPKSKKHWLYKNSKR